MGDLDPQLLLVELKLISHKLTINKTAYNFIGGLVVIIQFYALAFFLKTFAHSLKTVYVFS